MTAIVGPTLPDPYCSQVEEVWADIAAEFGENGISNPYPHFTLYGLDDDVATDAVERAVADVAASHDPFTVHADGLGVFPGHHVYVPVAKSERLMDLHRAVVDALAPLGSAPTPFYEPHRWFPHVALAIQVDDERVGEVVSFLLERDFAWEFTVDNVEVTRPPEPGAGYERVASVSL